MTTRTQRDQEKINRAELARQVLENPIYIAAFQALRADIYQKLGKVSPNDLDQIQELTLYLQNTDKLENVIKNYYAKGKIVIETRSKLEKQSNIS